MSMEKVAKVNEILLKGEPANISVDEHSGYTGYKPQAVVDAMNEVFWGEWGFEEVSSEITPGEKGLAIAQVRVWLKGVESQPTSYGQNRVTRGDIGDARKGAQTDAIKKALSYFSIGNRAYHGLLPDKKEQAQARQQVSNQRPPAARPAQATNERKPAQEAPKPARSFTPLSASVSQPTAPAERLTYRAVYEAGKEKGLWEAANGFYAFASAELDANVNKDTVKNLAMPNLERLMKAVQEEKPVAKAS